jgi:hypothetical protein
MSWFWHSIGLDDDFVANLDKAELGFHLLDSWPDAVMRIVVGVLLLVLLAGLGVFIYFRHEWSLRTVPRGLRWTLTGTRVLILALLFLVLAGPYLKIDHQSEKKPIVAVLFDHSQSMQLEAGPFPSDTEVKQIALAAGYRIPEEGLDSQTRLALNRMSRAKLVHAVVQANAKTLLEPLAKKFDLQFYSVANDVLPVTATAGRGGTAKTDPIQLPEPPLPRKDWGSQTYLGDAIGHVFREASGRQVSGIVVFTDGQNTGGQSLPAVAREAAAAGAPVFAVPAGTSARRRDVAIADVFTPTLLSKDDTARVRVTVESQGFDNRPVQVLLKEGETILDTKDLVLRGAEQQQVELTFKATKPGPHFLTVHIPPLPEEPKMLHGNNTDTTFIRVSEDKLRVLYLEGLPRWDFRFLKNAMRRDHGLGGRFARQPDIVLEAEWQRLPPVRQSLVLPNTLEALAEYHTIILGDVSPILLNSELLGLLDKAVREKGVGLVVEVGPQHLPHAFDERLIDLLPVRHSRNKDKQLLAGLASPDYKPFQLELSPEGMIHEAMRFYDDPGRNLNAWRFMPPYYWCAAATRPAPAATVLAWNPNVTNRYGKLPLIAHHFAGKGRVLFVGLDSTWLWRQNVGDRYFYKFWGQAIRFVARRDQEGVKKSWMEVRPLRAQPGEKASVELMAYDGKGEPLTVGTLPVQVSDGKKTTLLRLTADPAVKGRYTGSFPLEVVGEYKVIYQSGSTPVEAKVRVMASIEELRHPHVDRVALQRLADASGGRMVELTQLASIPEQLKGTSQSTLWHRETDIWDNWLVLVVLVSLYSVDVGLRRLAGLS